MAQKTSNSQQTPTKANTPLIPAPTDPRAELFWLLGRIEGKGVEGAARIATLVIELTMPNMEAVNG